MLGVSQVGSASAYLAAQPCLGNLGGVDLHILLQFLNLASQRRIKWCICCDRLAHKERCN